MDCTGLGYSGTTSIARAMKGQLSTGSPTGGHLPRHVTMHGLTGYLRVERVLEALGPHYRTTLEAVHVKPTIEVGRGQRQIAEHLGITYNALTCQLKRIREALRDAGR